MTSLKKLEIYSTNPHISWETHGELICQGNHMLKFSVSTNIFFNFNKHQSRKQGKSLQIQLSILLGKHNPEAQNPCTRITSKVQIFQLHYQHESEDGRGQWSWWLYHPCYRTYTASKSHKRLSNHSSLITASTAVK